MKVCNERIRRFFLLLHKVILFTDHKESIHTQLKTCLKWEIPQSSEGEELSLLVFLLFKVDNNNKNPLTVSMITQIKKKVLNNMSFTYNLISASADGGPRSWVCARKTLRSDPHQHEPKFSAACVCRVSFKHHSPPTAKN